jgi:transposase-like protein
MTKRSRRNHSASFKAKVALTLRGDKALIKIAQQYEVHPNQVKEWKWQLPERAANVFDAAFAGARGENEPEIKTLHAKIGQLTLENDFSSGALDDAYYRRHETGRWTWR